MRAILLSILISALLPKGLLGPGVHEFTIDDALTEPCELVVDASWKGSEPSVEISYFRKGKEKGTVFIKAPVGADGKCVRSTYRIPAFYADAVKAKIVFCVPEESALKIRRCVVRSNRPVRKSELLFHAHLGYEFLCPSNSLPAFEHAGMSGFRACICNPIETSDGEILCYHENHKDLRFPRDPEKSSLSAKEFRAMSMADAMTIDIGSRKSKYFKNLRFCTFEEFAQTCARYGMKVTLSQHPDLSPAGWDKLQSILEKYGLVEGLTVKSFNPVSETGGHANFEKVYSRFGSSISYVCDCRALTDDVIPMLKSLNLGNARVGIEVRSDRLTEEDARKILDAGFFLSVYSVNEDGFRLRELIRWGATEFTSSRIWSESDWMLR